MNKSPKIKPKFEDFKSKTKEIYRKYDNSLLNFVYDEVQKKAIFSQKHKNLSLISSTIYQKLKRNNLSILRLDYLIAEVQEYLIDCKVISVPIKEKSLIQTK